RAFEGTTILQVRWKHMCNSSILHSAKKNAINYSGLTWKAPLNATAPAICQILTLLALLAVDFRAIGHRAQPQALITPRFSGVPTARQALRTASAVFANVPHGSARRGKPLKRFSGDEGPGSPPEAGC